VGKALFLAKGCISCHWHAQADVPASQSYKVGPDLTNIESVPYGGMPNDADFLRKWLKDPQAVKPGTQMPNLGLSDGDIESLLAFLLTDERG
jgi:cytochrome c oxidase subunit 2